MSLNNIQLSGEACKNLFQNNLVQLIKTGTKEKSVSTKTESLGENLQKIFFLVNDPSCRFLTDDEMEMVTKLLSACKLSMADIALVNFYFNPMDYHSISEMFGSKKLLLFGVSSVQLELPFSIPFFQVQSFHDQLYMTAPPFRDFLNNKELKKELWTSLQKLFL